MHQDARIFQESYKQQIRSNGNTSMKVEAKLPHMSYMNFVCHLYSILVLGGLIWGALVLIRLSVPFFSIDEKQIEEKQLREFRFSL